MVCYIKNIFGKSEIMSTFASFIEKKGKETYYYFSK